MSKHTPGPWTLGKGTVRVRTKTGVLVAEAYSTRNAFRYPPLEQRKANARLIAAAPELLDALRLVLSRSWDGPLPDDAREIATAAIAKATGEEGV